MSGVQQLAYFEYHFHAVFITVIFGGINRHLS